MMLLSLLVWQNCGIANDRFYYVLPIHSCLNKDPVPFWPSDIRFIGQWTHFSHLDVKSAPFTSKWTCRVFKYHQVIIFQDIYAAAEPNLVKHERHKPMLHSVGFNLCWMTNKPFYLCMLSRCIVEMYMWPLERRLSACSVGVCWVHVRALSSEDGSGQSTATGIMNRGRDYFKCQHNVMSCVRRSNVQTVLSGEQLIDQVRFVLLWLLWWIE